ncbi:MAG: hypothetical protein CME40_15660 [Haliea sp.]|nr:hypothetical protein [Haliea sp.]|tara:strand:- start:87927 stop:88562 length:636 start_codon:yes stop_codon:yes gene_type:complete
MSYLAIIGDICGSREVAGRGTLQLRLQQVLDELNELYGDALVSPFTITLGDEFQALLSNATPVWQMIATLQSQLFPVQVRFGIGVGNIDTAINSQAALGMDGPAFHRARDAIDVLKEQGVLYRIGGVPDVDLANHSLALVSHLQSQWKQTRFQVYQMYLAGLPVSDMAENLKISRTAIYKNINDGALEILAGISGAIASSMQVALDSAHGD